MNKIIKKTIAFCKSINNHYSSFIDKHKFLYIFPKNIILLILLIILSITSLKLIINNEVVYKNLENGNGVLDKISNDFVEQKIDTKKVKNIKKFGLYFSTYSRENNSIYKIVLLENNKVVYKKKFNSKILKDNSLHTFDVGLRKIDNTSIYKFQLIPIDVPKDNEITINMDDDEIAYYMSGYSDFYYLVIILSLLFLLLFFVLNVLINNDIIKNEKSYLIVLLLYILPILFIIPALEVPDESFHYYKSYRLSQYNFSKTLNYNMKKKKILLPVNYKCINYSYSTNENVTNINSIKNCFSSNNNKYQFEKDGRAISRLFVMLPAVIGIKVADFITNSPLIIFYVGRLFTFALSFFMLVKALDIIPKNRKILLLVICIPMFIQQLISYSYDSILNSSCVLLVAYLVKFYYQDERIKTSELLLYSLLSLIILIIKLPYVLISIPILFIDKNKFGNNKKSIILKNCIYLVVLILGIYKARSIGDLSTSTKDGISRGNSLSGLIKNPISVAYIVKYTLKEKFFQWLESLIGIFGWLRYKINDVLIYSYLFVLIFLGITNPERIDNKKFKYLSMLCLLLLTGGIILSMYLGWTPTGSYIIEGIQGRYFISFIPLLLFLISSKKVKIEVSSKFIYSFINISMITTIITLMVSFY